MTMPLPASKTEAQGNLDPINFDQEWEGFAEAAVAAYEDRAFSDCVGYCRKATALLEKIGQTDPWRASTLNNLGIAELLEGNFSAASRSFAEAGDAWRQARAWVRGMTLESRARSSLFHLRLEQKHRRAFDPVLRARNLRSLTAARAASLFNRAIALTHRRGSACLAPALETAQRQRLKALGPRNPEVAAMLRLRAGLGDPAIQAGLLRQAEEIDLSPAPSSLESWRQRHSTAKADERHLLAAAHLTIVVTPECLEQGLSLNRWRRETRRADPTSGQGRASL